MSDINVDQTVNQAQAQAEAQQQQQQQGTSGFPFVGVPHVAAQVARATNQNVIVGNTGAVTIGPQTATAVNIARTAIAAATAAAGIPVLTAVATAVTSVTNPSTGFVAQTMVTPLFTLVTNTPPGVGALPGVSLITVTPPATISTTATSVISVTNGSTGFVTETITTPLFTATVVTPPGVGALPTITITPA